MTKSNTVNFRVHDTTPFSLRDYLNIDEDGVKGFLEKIFISSEKKFVTLAKKKRVDKNVLLITHTSSLEKATNVVEKLISKKEGYFF